MEKRFTDALLNLREMRIAAPFHCDPAVSVRPAVSAERKLRRTHTRRDKELMVVLDGEGEVMVGDKILRGGPGTVFLIDGGVVHDNGYPHGAPYGIHLWFTLEAGHSIAYAVDLTDSDTDVCVNAFCPYRHLDAEFVQQLLTAWRLAEEHHGTGEYTAELLALIRLRAVQLIRMEREHQMECVPDRTRHRQLMNMAMRYIERQCGKNCSIGTLAQMTGYSRSSFIKLFRRHANCNVLDFVNRQRVRRYNSMKTKPPVKLIAAELGFHSSSAFIKWRKKHIPER